MARKTTPVDPDRPRNPREAYGEELRLRREAAGLTQAELAELVVCSPSLIAHFEAGRRKPSRDDAKRLDQVLNTGGLFLRFWWTLDTSKYADHFKAAAEAEGLATAIEEYAVSLVPGILQTPGYARAVFRAVQRNWTEKELDERVVNRIQRSSLLDVPDRPRLWVILSENVLRTVVGGPVVMAEQLERIGDLAGQGRILVQVVPHSAGAHATMESMLSLMHFLDGPDLAYVEGLMTGSLIDDPALVQHYREAYDLARATALSPEASLHLIKQVAEEYHNEQSQH